jgi:gliding motility-associated-like protein
MINIMVAASDGTTTRTYTVNVIRAPLTNAYLYNLKVNTATISPAFAYTTFNYTANVSNATQSVTITPVVSSYTATVTVNGAAVNSASASGAVTLNVGSNTITTIVTAQDGATTQTYTVVITRAPAMSMNIPDEEVAVAATKGGSLTTDGIVVHEALSPNGDGKNDYFNIENITNYPDNKLTITNRSGQLVYEAKGYDNASKIFDGHSNKTGQMQLPGTYFYSLDYTVKGITKHKTGFIVLKY